MHRGELTFRLFSLTGFIKESKKVFLWSGIRWMFTKCQKFLFLRKMSNVLFSGQKSVWMFYFEFKKAGKSRLQVLFSVYNYVLCSGYRKECGCAKSIDVGAYNTCLHNCAYCYAINNYNSPSRTKQNPSSPLLCSELTADDKVTDREVLRLKEKNWFLIMKLLLSLVKV